MRIITMLLVTLLIGAACMVVWVFYGNRIPEILKAGPDRQITEVIRRERRRSAPYVILAPAETLPEKIASAPPEPPAVTKAPLAKTSPSPAPAQKEPSPAKAPAAPPATKPPPASTSAPIAKQTLEALASLQPEHKPMAEPKPQPAARTVPEPKLKLERRPVAQVKPKPVVPITPEPMQKLKRQPAAQIKPKPTAPISTPAASPSSSPPKGTGKARQPKRQLTYEVETKRQSVERVKQQSFSAKKTIRFRRVIPLGTGRFQADKKIIVLAGIEALAPDSQCKYASGKSWECGKWGRYALGRFIRGRSIVCDLIGEISATEVTGSCKVADSDINQWIVRRGWGKPTADSAGLYAAALTAAKKDKVGQWVEAPKSTP